MIIKNRSRPRMLRYWTPLATLILIDNSEFMTTLRVRLKRKSDIHLKKLPPLGNGKIGKSGVTFSCRQSISHDFGTLVSTQCYRKS